MRNDFSYCLLNGVQNCAGRKVCPKHRYHKMVCSMLFSKSLLAIVVKTFPIAERPCAPNAPWSGKKIWAFYSLRHGIDLGTRLFTMNSVEMQNINVLLLTLLLVRNAKKGIDHKIFLYLSTSLRNNVSCRLQWGGRGVSSIHLSLTIKLKDCGAQKPKPNREFYHKHCRASKLQ